jgi:hypothetical protein
MESVIGCSEVGVKLLHDLCFAKSVVLLGAIVSSRPASITII